MSLSETERQIIVKMEMEKAQGHMKIWSFVQRKASGRLQPTACTIRYSMPFPLSLSAMAIG